MFRGSIIASWFGWIALAIIAPLSIMSYLIVFGSLGCMTTILSGYSPCPTILENFRGTSLGSINDINVSPSMGLGFGALLLGLLTAPFIFWRSVVAQNNLYITEQGNITDRINKAVEGLGATRQVKRQRENDKGILISEETTEPNIEVRIGAIYALEKIAKDNLNYHIQIMNIFCSYIRNNCGKYDLSPDTVYDYPESRDDVKEALHAIGRRNYNQINCEKKYKNKLNLQGIYLHAAEFKKRNFSNVDFMGSYFVDIYFEYIYFNNCIFEESYLINGCFKLCKFRISDFKFMLIKDSRIIYSHFNQFSFYNSSIINTEIDDFTKKTIDLSEASVK